MLAGQLFVLFGLNVKEDSFRTAYKHLAALQVVSTAVVRTIRSVGEGLTELLTESAKAGTHLLGTAASLGMSTKSVQEWSYVAKQAGSNIDQFVVGISMFERNLREFAAGRGSKRFKDAMHEIGMSHVQAKQALLGPDGVNAAIFQVSDAYLKMGNTANRAAINTGLFGARARGMAQDLGQGSAALRQRIAELNGMGGVVGNDQLQKLKEFDNSITKIQTSLHALAMQVVAELAPTFTALVESITKWIQENRELISDVLGTAFKVLGFVFQMLFGIIKALGKLIQGVMNGDGGAIFLFSMLTAGVITLSVAILTALWPAIVIIGAAIWAAMAPLLPFGLLLAALIMAGILIVRHWQDVKDFFAALWDGITSAASAVWDGLVTIGGAIADAWHGFADLIKRAFWAAFEFIVEKAVWVVNKLVKLLNYLPGVNIGEVGVPSWAKHDTAPGTGTADDMVGGVSLAPGAKARPGGAAPPGVSFGQASSSPGQSNVRNVHVAPTTVNIYGVKDAKEASGHISNTIDTQNRHAAAALGGEVH